MQKATFSLVNYLFDKVLIDLTNHSHDDLHVDFHTSGIFDSSLSKYDLQFKVKVSNNQTSKVFAEISCKGEFDFKNIAALEEIPDYFYRNSMAILFPYVRAYLSLVTTQANVPGIILPTLNLSNLEAELKKNTTQI